MSKNTAKLQCGYTLPLDNHNNIIEQKKYNTQKNVLSLFSGCGGMDIGFEGGFECLKDSINLLLHPDWVEQIHDDWVLVKRTGFNTVFANDIRPDAISKFVEYLENAKELYENTQKTYHELIEKHSQIAAEPLMEYGQ